MISRSQKTDQDIRKRQIDTLKIFNDNVHEIIENEKYAVGFFSNNRPIQIIVELTVDFPNEKPKLTVLPALRHSWIQEEGDIQAPGLVNFTVHSDLGRVVQAIIREFEKHPPPFLYEIVSSVSPQNNDTAAVVPTFNIPELAALHFDQLEELNSDPQYLEDFAEEMTAVKSLNDELLGLMGEIEGLANKNIEKRDRLKNLDEHIRELTGEFKELGEKYDHLNQKHQKKSEEFAPQHIKELLQIAASTADTTAEQHTENFFAKKIDVETFLNEYMDAKKLSVLRKTKEERLTYQLNELERSTY